MSHFSSNVTQWSLLFPRPLQFQPKRFMQSKRSFVTDSTTVTKFICRKKGIHDSSFMSNVCRSERMLTLDTAACSLNDTNKTTLSLPGMCVNSFKVTTRIIFRRGQRPSVRSSGSSDHRWMWKILNEQNMNNTYGRKYTRSAISVLLIAHNVKYLKLKISI